MKRNAFLFFCLAASFAWAQPDDNVIRLEGISIQGGSDEPQVKFVAPWKEPPGTGRLYQDASSYRQQWLHSLDQQRLQYELQLPEHYLRQAETDANN